MNNLDQRKLPHIPSSSKLSPQLAIGKDGKVSLWCTRRKYKSDPHIVHFEVINGMWDGKFDTATGKCTVKRYPNTPMPYETEILWEGKAPFSHDQYNSAISWIEEQIKWTPTERQS